jgi:hypothetical protein
MAQGLGKEASPFRDNVNKKLYTTQRIPHRAVPSSGMRTNSEVVFGTSKNDFRTLNRD